MLATVKAFTILCPALLPQSLSYEPNALVFVPIMRRSKNKVLICPFAFKSEAEARSYFWFELEGVESGIKVVALTVQSYLYAMRNVLSAEGEQTLHQYIQHWKAKGINMDSDLNAGNLTCETRNIYWN